MKIICNYASISNLASQYPLPILNCASSSKTNFLSDAWIENLQYTSEVLESHYIYKWKYHTYSSGCIIHNGYITWFTLSWGFNIKELLCNIVSSPLLSLWKGTMHSLPCKPYIAGLDQFLPQLYIMQWDHSYNGQGVSNKKHLHIYHTFHSLLLLARFRSLLFTHSNYYILLLLVIIYNEPKYHIYHISYIQVIIYNE